MATPITSRHAAPLLDLDPELGQLLAEARFEEARQLMTVATHQLDVGPWDAERLRGAGPEHVGLLLVDGVISREVALADIVSCELLGPGDIVRPWQLYEPAQLLQAEVRWTVLEPGRLGVLDRRFAALLTRFPEVNAMLIERLNERAQRLAAGQAICQLNGVDRRLLALFWHLAERWGRVVPSGVVVPLPITHRLIAQLVGARRPTVSTALRHLAESGRLIRADDHTWLLTGEPVGIPTGEAARVIRGRRRRRDLQPQIGTPDGLDGSQVPTELAARGRIDELRDALDALRDQSMRNQGDFTALQEETRTLLERLDRDRNGGAAQTG